jgi:23S rRNA (pseudouridine1915-N3)-methyltransferase
VKILIISIGKEKDTATHDLISEYEVRLLRHFPLEWLYIAHSSKEKESEQILAHLKKEDYVVLLDEKGTSLDNTALAELVENRMVDSTRRMVFVIGGAYGVTPLMFKRAQYVWKLSSLVFPHRIVRVVLLEQLYRTMSILQGEKYHHG